MERRVLSRNRRRSRNEDGPSVLIFMRNRFAAKRAVLLVTIHIRAGADSETTDMRMLMYGHMICMRVYDVHSYIWFACAYMIYIRIYDMHAHI